MSHPCTPLALLLAALLAAPGTLSAQKARPNDVQGTIPEIRRLVRPFPRLADTGREGFVSTHSDANTYAAFAEVHDTGLLGEVTDVPLPGGSSIDLVVRPIEVWEPGGTAVVYQPDGSIDRIAPRVKMFAAYVPGTDSRGFVAISPSSVQGFLTLEDINYFLSNGGVAGGVVTLAHENSFSLNGGPPPPNGPHADHEHEHADPTAHEHTPGWCHYDDSEVGVVAIAPEPLDSGSEEPVVATSVPFFTGDTFLEVDKRVRRRFDTPEEVVDYVTLLVGAANTIYRRDIGWDLRIPDGHLRISDGVDDIWETFTGGYENWFNSPNNPSYPVQRHTVVKLTGFGRGSSARGRVCHDPEDEFAYVEIKGSFPFPIKHTHRKNWDLYAFGQENGHLLASGHTYNFRPVIECEDGSGPDRGTLMSYCAFPLQLWQPQEAQAEKIGMRFHQRVQRHIIDYLTSRGCLNQIDVLLGDYDGNGVHDLADLSELDALLGQGFRSLQAEAVFDLDQDGDVDADDRDQLLAILVAPATTTLFNGTGVNREWFQPGTQPILGSPWRTTVQNPTGPALTVVVGANARLLPPVRIPAGEVLIALEGLGGQTLFRSFAMSGTSAAVHTNPIPYDTSFVGLAIECQAGVFRSAGLELTNGLTIEISTY